MNLVATRLSSKVHASVFFYFFYFIEFEIRLHSTETAKFVKNKKK